MKNYTEVSTCCNCKLKIPYINDENKKKYRCAGIYDEDTKKDYVCGDHPGLMFPYGYRPVDCCYNCKNNDDGICEHRKQIIPNGLCDKYMHKDYPV